MVSLLDDPASYTEKGIICIPLHPLHHGFAATVDEVDYHLVAGFKWYLVRNKMTDVWYARTYMPEVGKSWKSRLVRVRMHHLIMPGYPSLDHRDRNGCNCCRSNLRPTNQTFNQYNTQKRAGKSKYRGVAFWRVKPTPRPWVSRIDHRGVAIHLGHFATEEEAAHAYDNAAREIAGEFATLNFPTDPIWLPLPETTPLCRNGHERTPDNLYRTGGVNVCRKCYDASQERYRLKKLLSRSR